MIGYIASADVASASDLAHYTSQNLGTPTPTKRDVNFLTKSAKEFFVEYPHASWQTLCRVVDWAKSRRMRPAQTFYIVSYVRFAWQAGFVPELDPANRTDASTEDAVSQALDEETDPQWRSRLQMADGAEARKAVVSAWLTHRQASV